MDATTVLTVNSGSSSLRLDLFATNGGIRHLTSEHLSPPPDPGRGIVDRMLRSNGIETPGVVAHRVVHGGARLDRSCLVDARVEREIDRLGPLAPLHNPIALGWIRAVREALGSEVPQIAAFDTAFYTELPAAAASYALPADLCARHGIRRYGFHGLAHCAMAEFWAARTPQSTAAGDARPEQNSMPDRDAPTRGHAKPRRRRVISLQLGAGCSVTATDNGRAVETSMGFSPLEGLVMSTRCGDLDPGILLYLQREANLGVDDLDSLLNDYSGLLGLSGVSGDMASLLESDDPQAELAVAVFCHRARKYVGAYLAVLGGADAILFGGGIGEHAPAVRERIVTGLEEIGIRLDRDANLRADGDAAAPIHDRASAVALWVVPVDEAGILAREALNVLRSVDRETDVDVDVDAQDGVER